MDEYPKVIQIGTLKVTVNSAAEEAHWRSPVVAEALDEKEADIEPADEAVDPIDDAAVEPPVKKKATTKKGEKKK